MRKLNKAALLAFAYGCGLIVATFFYVLVGIGRVKIDGRENFPHWQERMVIVPNHPSLIDGFMVMALFMPEWVFSPVKWGTWNTPDEQNTKTKTGWLFWVAKARNILAPRRTPGQERKKYLRAVQKFLRRVHEVLKRGGRVILFAEGRRTDSKAQGHFVSRDGHKICQFQKSVGEIVSRSGASVLPLFIHWPRDAKRGSYWKALVPGFSKHRVVIRIGALMRFDQSEDPEAIRVRIQKTVLELADG